MGQKIKPIGLRVGINRTWDSRWYAGRNYGELLHQDIELRSYLMDRLKQAAISRVVIERPAGRARVTIHAGRPGLIIGKKGQDIERLRADLSKKVGSEVSLNIVEVRKPEIDAKLLRHQERTRSGRHQRVGDGAPRRNGEDILQEMLLGTAVERPSQRNEEIEDGVEENHGEENHG